MHTTTRQRIGLGVLAALSALNLTSLIGPAPGEGEPGPPFAILALCTILGIIGLVAVVVAWRSGNQPAMRLAAGSVAIATLTALPAFFVDVPVAIKAIVATTVLLTLIGVALVLTPRFGVSDQPTLHAPQVPR